MIVVEYCLIGSHSHLINLKRVSSALKMSLIISIFAEVKTYEVKPTTCTITMDFLNTNISYQEMRRALSTHNATEEHKRTLMALDQGYDLMKQEFTVCQERFKSSVFRLFRRMMTSSRSPAQRLGIMMAMNDLGIQFSVKDESELYEKMRVEELRECKQHAIREAGRKENRK